MAQRDASVFHRYTAFLARRAGRIVLRWTVLCGLLGGLLGAVTLSSWADWPVSHRQAYLVTLLGAVSGAFLGRAIGSGRAQMSLFQAQLARHQLEFERRLLEVGAMVVALQQQPPVEAPPAPEALTQPGAPAELEPAAAPTPVYLPEPSLVPAHELPPAASDPVAAPEPVAAGEPEPEPEPERDQDADVFPFVPRPEPVLDPPPDPAAAAHTPVATPEERVPSGPAGSPGDGRGWWRRSVNEQ